MKVVNKLKCVLAADELPSVLDLVESKLVQDSRAWEQARICWLEKIARALQESLAKGELVAYIDAYRYVNDLAHLDLKSVNTVWLSTMGKEVRHHLRDKGYDLTVGPGCNMCTVSIRKRPWWKFWRRT